MARMATVDLTITAGKQHVGTPFFWQLCREFDLRVSIEKANVDADFAFLQLELEGAVEDIQRATAWLMTTGMHIEARQRAVGANVA